MTYSMDLRKRVVAALAKGESATAVARRFEVGRSTAREWQPLAGSGHLEPAKPDPTCPRKLTPADDQILRDPVAARPGITVKELMRLIDTQMVESTVDRVGAAVKKVADRRRTGSARGGGASAELPDRASLCRSGAIYFSR